MSLHEVERFILFIGLSKFATTSTNEKRSATNEKQTTQNNIIVQRKTGWRYNFIVLTVLPYHMTECDRNIFDWLHLQFETKTNLNN